MWVLSYPFLFPVDLVEIVVDPWQVNAELEIILQLLDDCLAYKWLYCASLITYSDFGLLLSFQDALTFKLCRT
jgi:hypothetical protein